MTAIWFEIVFFFLWRKCYLLLSVICDISVCFFTRSLNSLGKIWQSCPVTKNILHLSCDKTGRIADGKVQLWLSISGIHSITKQFNKMMLFTKYVHSDYGELDTLPLISNFTQTISERNLWMWMENNYSRENLQGKMSFFMFFTSTQVVSLWLCVGHLWWTYCFKPQHYQDLFSH